MFYSFLLGNHIYFDISRVLKICIYVSVDQMALAYGRHPCSSSLFNKREIDLPWTLLVDAVSL